jgi:pyruvate-formate lyase-activating enzyme
VRLFIYEECESIVEEISLSCGTTPTKYINTLLKILHEDCHKELTGEVNDRVKEFISRSARFNKD